MQWPRSHSCHHLRRRRRCHPLGMPHSHASARLGWRCSQPRCFENCTSTQAFYTHSSSTTREGCTRGSRGVACARRRRAPASAPASEQRRQQLRAPADGHAQQAQRAEVHEAPLQALLRVAGGVACGMGAGQREAGLGPRWAGDRRRSAVEHPSAERVASKTPPPPSATHPGSRRCGPPGRPGRTPRRRWGSARRWSAAAAGGRGAGAQRERKWVHLGGVHMRATPRVRQARSRQPLSAPARRRSDTAPELGAIATAGGRRRAPTGRWAGSPASFGARAARSRTPSCARSSRARTCWRRAERAVEGMSEWRRVQRSVGSRTREREA